MSARFDVIVVLGAALGPEGDLGPALAERVLAGVEAWRAGQAPMLLMTGSYEAEKMKRRAVEAGRSGGARARRDGGADDARERHRLRGDYAGARAGGARSWSRRPTIGRARSRRFVASASRPRRCGSTGAADALEGDGARAGGAAGLSRARLDLSEHALGDLICVAAVRKDPENGHAAVTRDRARVGRFVGTGALDRA